MPEVGDFGVCRTNSFIAWVIRKFTRSTVNHAVVYVGNGEVVEAQPGGARKRKVNLQDFTWSHVNLTDEQRTTVRAKALMLRGVPYGYEDIALIALGLLGVRWKWVLNRLDDEDTMICSQLVAVCYAEASIRLCPGKPYYLTTPGDLLDVIDHETIPVWW